MRFSELLTAHNAIDLDNLVEDPRQADIISKMDDPKIALKVMKSGLWYSYMFTRYTIPLYASHVFRAVSEFPMIDDKVGLVLAGVAGTIKGELYTNNIFGVPKECHAHYLDMEKAYLIAGGDPEHTKAIPTLEFTDRHHHYADCLKALLVSPLAAFILVPAVEKSTPAFFETVSKHLTTDPKFDPYRQFVNKHVELDRGEHSSVTMDWLALCVEKGLFPGESGVRATERVIKQVIDIISMSQGKR